MNPSSQPENHLDNDKEELKRNIMQVVDGFRFDQEWVSHQADDFPDHKGAGCGCGVCQKMKGINESTADSVLTFVDEYTQSKLKAFAGEVEEAIGEKEVSEYKQFDPNDEMILADQLIYDCRNDYRAELRESLKAIKERLIK